ncbi:IDEAL domain-containing protein [Paenibacillus sp. sptzw28]|nr:IDEAL domain-containing protein [Paenibacillus sp. sptzw28]
MMKFEIGEWVQGNTNQGELVHGFIESVDLLQGTVAIYVVASDNETAVGKKVEIREQSVKKLPVTSLVNKQQIESLIDIALSVRDEAWFTELTLKLNAIPQDSTRSGEPNIITSPNTNRLGFLG